MKGGSCQNVCYTCVYRVGKTNDWFPITPCLLKSVKYHTLGFLVRLLLYLAMPSSKKSCLSQFFRLYVLCRITAFVLYREICRTLWTRPQFMCCWRMQHQLFHWLTYLTTLYPLLPSPQSSAWCTWSESKTMLTLSCSACFYCHGTSRSFAIFASMRRVKFQDKLMGCTITYALTMSYCCCVFQLSHRSSRDCTTTQPIRSSLVFFLWIWENLPVWTLSVGI